METLFRFHLTRPAVEQEQQRPSIPLEARTAFQRQLHQALNTPEPRARARAVASAFVSSGDFIKDIATTPLGSGLASFGADLAEIERNPDVNHDRLVEAVQTRFGESPAVVTASPAFRETGNRLRDSILAIKFLPAHHDSPIEKLARALRDLELISQVHEDTAFPENAEKLYRYRRRSFLLPEGATLASVLHADDRPANRREPTDSIPRLVKAFRAVSAAMDELGRVSGNDLHSDPSSRSPAVLPPLKLQPTAVAERLNLAAMPAEATATVSVPREGILATLMSGAGSGAKGLRRLGLNGRSEFRSPTNAGTAFRLHRTAIRSLSKTTREMLGQLQIDLGKRSLDEAVDLLQAERTRLTASLEELGARESSYSLRRIGSNMVVTSAPVAARWALEVIGPASMVPAIPVTAGSVPVTHGEVKPAGIMDLKIVRQQLVRYEATDIAHIENVLLGESKVREHIRRRETEQITFTETEVSTSEERDLESTDRFEMSRETAETIQEDASLQAGLTVSGSYGPAVEFSASAEGALSRSREQSVQTASAFSKEITQRSASRITERVLQRETMRVTHEVEQRNTHTIDNTDGDGHIAGIYQWVEKVYQARMFNYGLRTLYDFMVAEPGAWLIETLRSAHAGAIELEKPVPFTLRPDQITEVNYHHWVQAYGATDVSPPPEMYRTKSLDYSAGGGDSDTDYNHSAQVQIDAGYRAVYGTVGAATNIWQDTASVDVVLGRRSRRISQAGFWGTALDGERDSLPFALNTFRISDIAVAVEVKCQRTERAMAQWRHETHGKLTSAWRAKLAEYEEALAALELQAGPEIAGTAPAANLELMKDELRKSCIAIMTEQHFDLFDAIENGPGGQVQLDLGENRAEGPYVRFFEQAFEWEHMTWVTYPYFWGRKSEWASRIALEDTDPLFNQFLKAGYCRVAVPVRPGFEGAVDHFMQFGEPWMGGPLPTVSNPHYLPIADEISERLDRPGEEIPEGEPWEVRVPTSLVHLREDDSLPAWHQNEAGDWVPDE